MAFASARMAAKCCMSWWELEAKMFSRSVFMKFRVFVSTHVAGMPVARSNSSLKACSILFFVRVAAADALLARCV